MAIFLHVKPNPDLYDEVYKHYFKTEDSAAVMDIWRLLLGAESSDDQGDGTGNPEFSKLNFINYSPYNSDPCDYSTIEYLSEPDANGERDFRVCDKAFEYPLIVDSTCDDLDDKVSGLMSTLSGILLHELVHYYPIGKVATGSHIQDYDMDGYGPVNTRKLLNDPDVGSTITNADSYRWMALEYYWSHSCDKSFGEATSNKDYRQCMDGDDEESCGILRRNSSEILVSVRGRF